MCNLVLIYSIQICYDSTSPNSDFQGSCSPSQCEFKVNIVNTAVSFYGDGDSLSVELGSVCDNLKVHDRKSQFNTINNIQTCPPRIENGIIHLNVIKADPQCQVEVVKTKPITVITDAKEQPPTVQTASKTPRPDLNFTQFEPSKSQKKQKKAVKKEPTTTEEFVPTPPPKVTVSSPPDLTKPFPKQPQYSIPQRVIPRSYKSLKTDSLEEIIQKNKLTPVESVIASVSRNVIKSKDSEVVKEMKKNYPEVRRVPLQCEIVLFCVKISLMFTELHEMTVDAEQKLVNLGVQFDAEHRIVSMSPEGREYLQNPKTPSTIVYFAFGAEYHEYILDDMNLLPKLSVAHQLVIALRPRFVEFNRRKALTWLRRELPRIRENYTAAERKLLPFPVNAIEKAYLHDPKFLISLSGIDTDSEADRRRMEVAKLKQLIKCDSNSKKRKGKASKKRQ
uniref:Uncharacterized protein n=1 Tax=Panagrolaimus sp. ES5 TaxID=591445 RepID=A0AC34GTY8_9BILA